MRRNTSIQRWMTSTAFGLVLAGSMAVSQAQPTTNIVISTFDSDTDPYVGVVKWWGELH